MLDVQHQPRAHRVIQRALHCGRMPHAYLFAGPDGVGKEMLALRLARTLLCSSPVRRPMPEGVFESGDDQTEGSGFRVQGSEGQVDVPTQSRGHGTRSEQENRGTGEQEEDRDIAQVRMKPDASTNLALDACGTCEDCNLVRAGTHPDLSVIYRQLNKQHPDSTIRKQKALFLGVEIIRHFLIDRAGLCPNRGRAKVFIVREAERLNESAQNALLKTLEEPPPATFIILLTDAMDRMLPTTRSRCQQVLFRSLPVEFVAERLAMLRPDTDPKVVTYAARHANGSLGAALRLVDDGLFELKRTWGEELVRLLDDSGPVPHQLARPFMEDAGALAKCIGERDPEMSDTDAMREGLQSLLAALADFYVDALRKRTGADLPLINEDQAQAVARLSTAMDERSLREAIKSLSTADGNLSRNAHVELTLEAMFIGLARSGAFPQPSRRAS